MGKTMVPIKSKGYKLVKGTVSGDKSTSVANLVFDSKIIALWYDSTSIKSGTTSHRSTYYVNPNLSFFNYNVEGLFDNTYPESTCKGYNGGSTYTSVTKVSDYEVTIKDNITSVTSMIVRYTAILEDNEINDSIFLLNGTTLLTDGTPTSDVADVIQTVDTNKYKIKSNALVNISNATYINLSN